MRQITVKTDSHVPLLTAPATPVRIGLTLGGYSAYNASHDPTCLYYDAPTAAWSAAGLTPGAVTASPPGPTWAVRCESSHLTPFAVAYQPYAPPPSPSPSPEPSPTPVPEPPFCVWCVVTAAWGTFAVLALASGVVDARRRRAAIRAHKAAAAAPATPGSATPGPEARQSIRDVLLGSHILLAVPVPHAHWTMLQRVTALFSEALGSLAVAHACLTYISGGWAAGAGFTAVVVFVVVTGVCATLDYTSILSFSPSHLVARPWVAL